MKIVLGSSSKQRKDIFMAMGYAFEVISSDIDERSIRRSGPKELALALAMAKSDSLCKRLQGSCILITADTVVTWDGTLREKPVDAKEALFFLETASEHPSFVYSAVVVTNTETKKRAGGVDEARVFFLKIPEENIENLIRRADVFGFAGGFAIEDPLIAPYVASVKGERGTIMGLPQELTEKLIAEVSE